MTRKVLDESDASKALDVLLSTLAKLTPAERARALARIEIAIDDVRARLDDERPAPADVKDARSLRRWARVAAHVVEHGDGHVKAYARGALRRVTPLVEAPARSSSALRAAVRIAAKYARWPGDVATQAPKLAASLSHALEASISVEDAAALLHAWRRRRGERSNGEPTKEEALFSILRPLGHAQSVDAIKQAMKRADAK